MKRLEILTIVAASAMWLGAVDVFTVAKDGVPQADIVVPAKPLDAERYAADELKYHLDKAFGANFEIVAEDACDLARRPCHFFLGATKAAKAAGIPGRELKLDERVVKTSGNGLYLLGRDSDIKCDRIQCTWIVKSVGTLYAVYDFLGAELGVMWIWPQAREGAWSPTTP